VTIAVMLTSADSIVLPVQVWNLWNTVSPNQAAAAAVMLAVIALGLMLAMRRIAERVFASGGH
jgi:ABC-type Fe3+ transport system permease subunit